MTKIISDIIRRNDHPPIAASFHFPERGKHPAPVILFLHGLRGFKDWGHFPLIAESFCRSGFVVVRFNFSMNGTTPDRPGEFADLEAFGKNTFSRELEDVGVVIDDLWWRTGLHSEFDPDRLGLLGHSRGGGIALLRASQDLRVKAVATWAGVSDFEPRVNPKELEKWKTEGVLYSRNSRTGQDMPAYYSLREDFYANKAKLDIPDAVKKMQVPQLIVHGTGDETVPYREAENMHTWNMFSLFETVEGANHTFGGRHPWKEKELPPDTIKALQPTIAFFRDNL